MRTTNAKPGSAWDTWHKAGYDYATAGGATVGVDFDVAAGSYAVERDLRKDVIERAFKEGAIQAAKRRVDQAA